MVSKSQFFKSAFTMIELIFAIVVIGITILSLPMVNQVTSQAVENNLVQEAVFAASTELNQVLSYHWDDNSTDGANILAKVVWTPTSTCDTTTKLRPGHINQPYHRKCLDDNDATPSIGSEGGAADDIDDFNGVSGSIFIDNTGGGVIASSKGYKKDYNSTVAVSFAAFGTVTAAQKNIKKVTVTISDAGNTITSLSAFSANIGEIDYNKRSYQ